ncbi:MAG TPA: hypothetical protein PK264_03350 [Hyphomicrobiaceae bacterium]|nr:hypothetical protein [Hyphomicrobiaceae bacterium]
MANYRTLLERLLLAACLVSAPSFGRAEGGDEAGPVALRNIGAPRALANKLPRSEADQALLRGWPLYRTERGQEAFNAAMATLKATEGAPPAASTFRGCVGLACRLALPRIGMNGWLPAGRIWVSPTEYVLIAHSSRFRDGQRMRRRMAREMRYLVLHEFHNGSRNTDVYDTISSHSRAVFVPLYMSRQGIDAHGHAFVVVVQVAPYDVASIHASNFGNAGPGIEVAKNYGDPLDPVQSLAGILVATMIKEAAPQLKVVHHRGSEGRAMLEAYDNRVARVASRAGLAPVALPFVPAPPARLASVSAGTVASLVRRGTGSVVVPVADRGILYGRTRVAGIAPRPMLIEPVAPVTADDLLLPPRLIGPILPAVRPSVIGHGAPVN